DLERLHFWKGWHSVPFDDRSSSENRRADRRSSERTRWPYVQGCVQEVKTCGGQGLPSLDFRSTGEQVVTGARRTSGRTHGPLIWVHASPSGQAPRHRGVETRVGKQRSPGSWAR